jgi:hypothetical protein
MVVQKSRRSFMAGMAATTTAAALLPVAAIGRDAGGASEELAYRTADDLVKAIASRQVSSRELVDSAISRIEALDPKINAVVVRDFERARAAADAADAALAKGENRALLGLPMTVKETIRRCRPADHPRRPDVQGLESRGRRLGGAAAQAGGRCHTRQDQRAAELIGLAKLQRGLRHHQ